VRERERERERERRVREERIFMYMLIYLSYIQTGEFRDELDVYDNLFTIYIIQTG
jgi:hypothetical protein